MSSSPGLTLEDYVAWEWNLVVSYQSENNISLGMVEALGITPGRRPVISKSHFAKLVRLYEEHRDWIEERLEDFDEERHPWRSYAYSVFSPIPDEIQEKARVLVKTLTSPTKPIIGNYTAGMSAVIDGYLFKFKRDVNLYFEVETFKNLPDPKPTSFSEWGVDNGMMEAVRLTDETVSQFESRPEHKNYFHFIDGMGYIPSMLKILMLSEVFKGVDTTLNTQELEVLAECFLICPPDCEFTVYELLERNIDDILYNDTGLREIIKWLLDLREEAKNNYGKTLLVSISSKGPSGKEITFVRDTSEETVKYFITEITTVGEYREVIFKFTDKNQAFDLFRSLSDSLIEDQLRD